MQSRYCLSVAFACVLATVGFGQAKPNLATDQVGNHLARRDHQGNLKPWMETGATVRLEMNFYEHAPIFHGLPTFISYTFLDGQLEPVKRQDSIPAMQSATGIESYLDYARWNPRSKTVSVKIAREFADYVLDDCLTPADANWPNFPRSTGHGGAFPQAPDCGSQGDQPYEIQPDKGGLFGYALIDLYHVTHEARYLEEAKKIGATLASHQMAGTDHSAPFPFRVDYRNGDSREPLSADMTSILHLYDDLIAEGETQLQTKRDALWTWIKYEQIPSVLDKREGILWVNFFEDYQNLETNRNSWSALQLVSYLSKKKATLDPDWERDAFTLMEFVNRRFTSIVQGVDVCGEQDDDKDPWGGVMGNYIAALADISKATGDRRYMAPLQHALYFELYKVDSDGCPGQTALYPSRGGWQEDCHTDVIHGVLEAFKDFPWLSRAH